MHVAILGTYPPTRCGIATFTADVEQSLADLGTKVTIIRVDPEETNSGPSIHRADPSSYIEAARWVNNSDVDVVLVQHEFGVYGGADGEMLLRLTNVLRVPYVVTLHTVLSPFEPNQAAVLEDVCASAAAVTVFTTTGRNMLVEQEICPANRVQIVPHGAPLELYAPIDEAAARMSFGLPSTGPIVSTFGLLSAGKGIEVAIRAMAKLVIDHPDARYVIAGRTHPEVVRKDGECYRDSLVRLVTEFGLEENVVFLDRFLSVEDLAQLLAITDVFCTPYHGEGQIVSGALTFALAAGCPVVSTPYRYASDVLADGAGLLVEFDDCDGMAAAIGRLLEDGPTRTAALAAAERYASGASWPAVGQTLLRVLSQSLAQVQSLRVPSSVSAMPVVVSKGVKTVLQV
jgi:glycosyltransferase involved in cell wall biosynthesis